MTVQTHRRISVLPRLTKSPICPNRQFRSKIWPLPIQQNNLEDSATFLRSKFLRLADKLWLSKFSIGRRIFWPYIFFVERVETNRNSAIISNFCSRKIFLRLKIGYLSKKFILKKSLWKKLFDLSQWAQQKVYWVKKSL